MGGRFDPKTCTAPAPKTETCDNQDNDCDGQRDEGDGLCPAPKNGTGVCRSGTCERECPNGIALCAGGKDCPLLTRDSGRR